MKKVNVVRKKNVKSKNALKLSSWTLIALAQQKIIHAKKRT